MAWLAAALALGGAARAGAASRALEVRSPRFVVYSDAGEKSARRLAGRFEQVRAAFAVFWPWARIDPGAPLVILASRDEDVLRELVPGPGGATAGFFSAGAARYYIGLRADLVDGQDDEALHLVFHEYAHLVLGLNFESLPLWLNEGIAELFGGGAVRPGYVELGRPLAPHVGRLRVNTLLPLRRLFAVDRGSPEFSEEQRTTLFYAQSWALVHYLLIDQREARPEAVAALFRHLGARRDALAALGAAGFDPAALERDLASYVRRPSLASIRAVTSSAKPDASYSSRFLSVADWDAVRSLFLAHLGRVDPALARLEAVLRTAPDLALAHEAVALARLRQGRPKEAVAPAEEAVRLAPDSLPARYTAALAHMGSTTGATGPEAPVRLHLRRAIELGPEYAPAHSRLARVLLGDRPEPDQAIELSRRAVQLEPSEAAHRLVLAQALEARSRFEEARVEAEQAVSLARDPALREAGREVLERTSARAPVLAQEEACEAGDERACVELGTRYHSGLGVERSSERAIDLFHRACAAGVAAGCTNEALALAASGRAGADTRAAELLAETCDKGDARACGALGALVEIGRGGAAVPGRAAELHRRACAGGYEPSCERSATLLGSDSSRRIEGWGELVDPSGGSKVAVEKGRLVIEVPAGPHDLSVEIGQMTAPRLLRHVEGNFVAEVTVSRPLRPGKGSTIPGHRLAFNGTGLLIWIDGGNYVRLEAAALVGRDGSHQAYTLFQIRTRGKMHDVGPGGRAEPPIRLKIERTDSGLRAYYQRPGSDWRSAGEIRGTFPRKLQVGVAAVNTSREAFQAELEGFRLETVPSSSGEAAGR